MLIGLFDDIEAISVAKVVQRTGYAACRKQNQVVPLFLPFEQLARRYGRTQVGYGLECCRIPVDRQLPPGVADGAEADLERYVLRITAFGLCLEPQGVKYRVAGAPYHRIGNLGDQTQGVFPAHVEFDLLAAVCHDFVLRRQQFVVDFRFLGIQRVGFHHDADLAVEDAAVSVRFGEQVADADGRLGKYVATA